MTRKSWSLSGRLTRLYFLSTIGLVLCISLGSSWFLQRSTEREISALLGEEFDELNAMFPRTSRTVAEFQEIAATLARKHPSNPFGWRVWSKNGELWGVFGAVELLRPDAPARRPMGEDQRLPGGMRWRTEEIETGHTVSLLVDGSAQFALLKRYQAFAAFLTLIATVLALVMGRLLVRRYAALLRRVAQSARALKEPGADVHLDLDGSPEEIREVADALHELVRNVRSESERQQLFTAGLAHELRSPVQNLIGETEVALINPRSVEGYRTVLRSLLEDQRQLADAVDNLISICSSRAPLESIASERFDLAGEARLRLEREKMHAEQVGVDLNLESEGDTHMRGDREAILRALRNLVDNAIDWSPAGGEVELCLSGDDEQVVATVDDAGPGVPVHLRERIFDPFFRGPSARGRRIGYGLGLAIVRTAVESQGGTIEVGVSPMGGARFRMVLPRERTAPHQTRAAS